MPDCLWRFGDCEFDEQRNELRVRGQIVEIETKPLDVLRVLLAHRGKVLTKEEILRQAWPGLNVVEASLATAISKLRKALAEGGEVNGEPAKDWIVTIPRVGYRFVAAEATVGNDAITPPPSSSPPRRAWIPFALATLLIAFCATAVLLWLPGAGGQSIRVEALRNAGPERETDFLGTALADEISTILAQADAVVVSRDAAQAANYIVRGHYQTGSGTLFLTLQVWNQKGDQLLWQETLHTPQANLVGLQAQLAMLARGPMGRTLHIAMREEAMAPQDPNAYRMYLESLGQDSDAAANRKAIALLEGATSLDAGYGPAWLALSKRYYIDDRYARNRRSERSQAAVRRALAVAPHYTAAAANLIVAEVEAGRVAAAIDEARRIVSTRPNSVEAHFSLSYALRFAGQLDEAAKECEIAYHLDSRNHMTGLRSCAVVHILRQDYANAYPYLELDGDTDFARLLRMEILLRQGKRREAQKLLATLHVTWETLPVLRAALDDATSAASLAQARKVTPSDDPETNYFYAAHLAYSGHADLALPLLERSLAGGYRQADALRTDPMFTRLRGLPNFEELCERARKAHSVAALNPTLRP